MDRTSYFVRNNADIIENYYQDYLKDPGSVDKEWQRFFEGLELGMTREPSSGSANTLVNTFRVHGHSYSEMDPLGIIKPDIQDLYKRAGFDSKSGGDPVVDKVLNAKGIKTQKDAVDFLKKTYCGHLTIQYNDCDVNEREFFVEEFENKGISPKLSKEDKKQRLFELTSVEAMEKFLHSRFVGMKRFSVEGSDTGVTLLETILQRAQITDLIVGMAHRGRINVLTNFMGKAIRLVLAEFEGKADPGGTSESGDVKYHMGFSAERKTSHGNVHVSLAFNPSHLEFVCPVVAGSVWARQRFQKDTEKTKVLPVSIHGDASFAGQGVVYETLQMANLEAYDVGGTVHIVFDNQVGFTASPKEYRSSQYSSDVAKVCNIPVIHVNGDDLEAVVRAGEIAVAYREKFKKDIVIRHSGYRRHGHNEGDEPMYTQPKMYDVIKKHPTVREIYAKQLVNEGVLSEDEAQKMYDSKIDQLQELLDDVKKSGEVTQEEEIGGAWKGLRRVRDEETTFKTLDTSALETDVEKTFKAMAHPPSDFNWNPKLKKQYEKAFATYKEDGHINWAFAEMAAYGSLILEGISVRITGQDAIRGTFSHRHAKFTDMKTEEYYSPLSTLNLGKADIHIHNSHLSETAVLGFEYGVSSADPWMLTIWEAQFGDFANGAQVITDQFISAGEAKWNRMSGIVLLLPHGYEGQGPEHSSARLERFANLCTNNNLQLINPTTPAQIFHALRRQVKRDFRKPLIVMSPKSLLRHPKVISDVSEITDRGSHFREVIFDDSVAANKVEEVLFCTGKVYYDLIEAQEKESKSSNQAIVRLEQIYPFPEASIKNELSKFKNLKQIRWVQEEPRNMGAYRFVSQYLWPMIKEMDLNTGLDYVGRPSSASPATGSSKKHAEEQRALIADALRLG